MRLQSLANTAMNRLAAVLYWLHETRHARLMLWLMVLGGMASLLFIRPGAVENAIVKTYKLSEVNLSTADTWVRINGILLPVNGYQTRFDLGAVELRGGRFIPMTHPNATDPLWVLDEDLPSYSPGIPVTVSGMIRLGTGDQPPFYLQPGLPPNVVLANWLARIGSGALVVSILLSALAWLARFAHYALPSLVEATDAASAAKAPHFLWYGDLGKEYGEVVVREMPCEFAATVHEVRFDSQMPRLPWKVCVRRLRSAQTTSLATRFGPMPAARIWFEDERGLSRRAVFAANSAINRDQVLQVMSLIR
jgi:hypothetical protein